MSIQSAATSAAAVAAASPLTLPPAPAGPADLSGMSSKTVYQEFARRFAEGEFDEFDLTFVGEDDDTPIEDRSALEQARDWWRRGDARETLHYLEMALGSDFYGLERILK